MADLNFMQLNVPLPGSPFKYNSAQDYYYIHLNELFAEPENMQLSDPLVGELLVILLEAANTAQVTYNADTNNPKDIRSYLPPTASAPTKDADGVYRSTFTYTVSIRRPLIASQIDAVEV